MKLILMVAMDRNGIIGRDGALPWHLRSDLQRFKRLTMGHVLIMGRKTFDSIGRPLPGRTTVVLSRSPQPAIDRVTVVDAVEGALRAAAGDPTPFVVGGAGIYELFLSLAEELWITWVEAQVAGETRFPNWNPVDWTELDSESLPAGEHDDHATRFVRYRRRFALDTFPMNPQTT